MCRSHDECLRVLLVFIVIYISFLMDCTSSVMGKWERSHIELLWIVEASSRYFSQTWSELWTGFCHTHRMDLLSPSQYALSYHYCPKKSENN